MPLRSSCDESPQQSSSQPSSSSEPSSQLRGQRQKRDKRGRGWSKRLQRPVDLSRATVARDPKRQSPLQDPRLGPGRYPGDGRGRSSTPARRSEQGDLEEQPRDHLRRAGNLEGGEPVAEKFGRAKKRGETSPPRRGEKIFEQLEEEPLPQEYPARMLGRGEEVVGRVGKELARIQEVSVDTHRGQGGWQQLLEAADRGEKDGLAEGAVEGDSRGGGNEEAGELERRQIDDRDGEILEISLPLRS